MWSIRNLLQDESGATMVEYAILVGFIALAVIATVVLIGLQLDAMYDRIVPCMRDPGGDACQG